MICFKSLTLKHISFLKGEWDKRWWMEWIKPGRLKSEKIISWNTIDLKRFKESLRLSTRSFNFS